MALQVKGGRGGIRVILDPSAPVEALADDLRLLLGRSTRFWQGAQLWLEVGDRPVTQELCQGLLDVVARFPGVSVRAIVPGESRSHPFRLAAVGGGARLWRGTLRAGQELQHHGDLVIVGDVNSGARVVATGDVIVIGSLRGVAHAGADGNATRMVYAGDFRPVQVRIGELIAVNPGREGGREPEVARVEDGRILVEPWRQALLRGSLVRREQRPRVSPRSSPVEEPATRHA